MTNRWLVILGLVAVLAFVVACAKSDQETAAPAPGVQATPSQATPLAPAAATTGGAPTAPTGAAVGAVTMRDAPLVSGGPVFERSKIESLKGWKLFQKYDQSKVPLWTKAFYGGEMKTTTSFLSTTNTDALNIPWLHRGAYFGNLLNIDYGLCSMVGRQNDYSVCNGKYAHNRGLVIVEGVFRTWQQVDALTYVFRINEKARWPQSPLITRADRSVTADDIVWFLNLHKTRGHLADNFTLVDRFEAVDRSTVRIALKDRHADFMLAIAHTSMGVFPKECYTEGKGLDKCLEIVVSPAPFIIRENIFRQRVTLEKNPDFHLNGLPFVDGIKGVAILDPNALRAAFYTRQIENTSASTEEELLQILKQAPDARYAAAGILSGSHGFRFKFEGPFADIRVRRAMAMTSDPPSMWEAGLGGFTLFPTLLGRQFFGEAFYMSLDQAGQWYQFDPQRAKQLMVEAGYPNGFKTSIQTSFGQGGQYDIQIFAQAQWKKYLGIDMEIKVVENTAHQAGFFEAKWDALWFWWCWNITCWADADATFVHFLKGSRFNPQKIDDPFIEDLYRKQRGELDPAKRVKLLWDFEQHELDKIYYMRQALGHTVTIVQPWQLNAASHDVTYWSPLAGAGWMGIVDPNIKANLVK